MNTLHSQILGVLALECVDRCGNYKEAAKELQLSVPAVSRRIKKLESEIGLGLVARQRNDGRCKQLSTEGLSLVRTVGPLLAGIEQALNSQMNPRSKKNRGL
jgi:DNA-binding transcriptional LysR family regulator